MKRLLASMAAFSTMGVSWGFVTVGESGADFNSLALAVEVVNAGEEIRVSSSFVEDEAVTTTKNLTITSYTPTFSTPEPGARLDAPLIVDASSGPIAITVDGLHLNDQTSATGASIYIWGGAGSLTMRNGCRTTGIGNGVVVYEGAAGSTLSIMGSNLTASRNAVSIRANSTVNVKSSTVGPSGFDAIAVNPTFGVDQVTLALDDTLVSGSETNGIDIFRYTDLTLNNCTIAYNKRSGILLDASMSTGSLSMTNCDINNNGQSGFATLALLNPFNIQGCNFVGNGTFGLATNFDTAARNIPGAGGINAGTIGNCKFNDNNHSGIYFGRHINVTFDACQMNNNYYHGVTIQDPRADNADYSDIVLNNCEVDFNGRGRQSVGHNMEMLAPLNLTLTSASLSNSQAGMGLHLFRGPASTLRMTDVRLNNNKTHGFYSQSKLIDTSIVRCQFNNNVFDGLVTQTPGANFSNFGVITDSQFNNNTRHGIHINNGLDMQLQNCTLTGNTTFGIVRTGDIGSLAGAGANFTLSECDITGNAYAVGMYSTIQNWNVTDCLLSNGAGGNAVVAGNASSRDATGRFTRCYLSSTSPTAAELVNTTKGAIISTPISFSNCVFDGGPAGFVKSLQSNLSFDYCTFATRAQAAGTAFAVSNGAGPEFGTTAVTVDRSIISGLDTAIAVETGGLMEVTNSLVNGAVTGITLGAETITNEDPKFVDAANGNYSLTGSSPAVAKVPFTAGDVDYLGTLRPQPVTAALADMGAFEVNESSSVSDWVIY
jgi:hypothetical protein